VRDEEQRRAILDQLPEAAKLAIDLDRLKNEKRENPLTSGDRKELVAEHSWHVALTVALLADYSSEPINLGHAALLANIHDVAEAFVGDTFAYGPNAETRAQRERVAMEELRDSSSAPAVRRLFDLWEEYEAGETSEARFANAIDTFLPIVMNFMNIDNSSWVEHHVAAKQVIARLDRVRNTMGDLAALSDAIIEQARRDGDLQ